MIKVEIYFIDGSMGDFEENDSFISRLWQLENEGYKGKSLVDTLISDDWGAPPTSVLIKGTLADGQKIDKKIRYD